MKYLSVILLLIIAFASCQKDEDHHYDSRSPSEPPTEPRCFVNHIIEGNGDNVELEYINNKISEVTEVFSSGAEEMHSIYEYNNGILSSVKVYENDTMTHKNEYVIENNRISKVSFFSIDNAGNLVPAAYETHYSYNSDDQISVVEYKENSIVTQRNEYTWENGNLKEEKYYTASNGSQFGLWSTYAYTYDDQKNPLRGIGIDFFVDSYNINNILEKLTSYTSEGSTDRQETYTYEYNSNGYPTKITKVDQNGSVNIDEYTYTYTCN